MVVFYTKELSLHLISFTAMAISDDPSISSHYWSVPTKVSCCWSMKSAKTLNLREVELSMDYNLRVVEIVVLGMQVKQKNSATADILQHRYVVGLSCKCLV